MELRKVERYWETRIQLVFALKEGVASSLIAGHEVKSEVPEGVFVVNVEEIAPAMASTSSPLLSLSRYA
jgi:hypothetical protein